MAYNQKQPTLSFPGFDPNVLQKENITPRTSDRFLHFNGPKTN